MAIGILVGLFCGALSGLGVGGGSILMVWLTAVRGFDQRIAQGINLLFFLPTALSSAFVHARSRIVETQIVIPAAISGAVAACAGAFLAQRIDTEMLRRLFGALLLVIGALELKKAWTCPKERDLRSGQAHSA